MPATTKERFLDDRLKAAKHIGIRAYVRREMGKGVSVDRIAVALCIATEEHISGPCLHNWVNRWVIEDKLLHAGTSK